MITRILSLLVLATLVVPMLQQSFGTVATASAMHSVWEEQHLVPAHHHHDGYHQETTEPTQNSTHMTDLPSGLPFGLPTGLMDVINDLLHLDSLQVPHHQSVQGKSDGDKNVLAAIWLLVCFLVIGLVRRPDSMFAGQEYTDRTAWRLLLTTGRLRI